MRITECTVEGFGTLSSAKYDFSKGLNSIVWDNGRGKSTLAAFITAMLYGLSDTKKQSLDENERKKYAPWGGGTFGGSLTFECERGLYRIERSFGKKASEDTFRIFNAKTGRISPDFSGKLGEELFGIDSDGFLRTVFLSERTLSEKNENKSVSAKLSGVVGIDADMGEIDHALAILDEKRRLYSKRGGAGIISDTRSRCAELDAEIARLRQKALTIPEGEAELSRIEAALVEAKEKKAGFENARLELENERRVKTYKDQYENMRRGLVAEEEKYRRLTEFFENGKPTYEEIDEMRMKKLEFERVMSESAASPEDSELRELREFFSSGVSSAETDRIYELAASISEADIDAEPEVPSEFSLRLPSKDELDTEIAALKKARSKKSRKPFGFITLALGLLSAGAALFRGKGSFEFIPLLIAGGALAVLALVLLLTDRTKAKGARAEAHARELILSISSGDAAGDSLEILAELKAKLEEYERAKAGGALREAERRKNEEALHEIYDFLAKFPAPTAKTLLGAVGEIKEKHRRLDALTLMSERLTGNMSEKKRAAVAGMEEVALFLSRFKTSTDRPLDEIRDALGEFTALAASIESKRHTLDDFARLNGIDVKPWSESALSELEIDSGRKSAEDKIFELSRQKVLIERRLDSDRADVERLDSLISERETLDANERKYESNLSVILKTADFLKRAHENMRGRYLDKTLASFKNYMSVIGDSVGEFVLDTDFTLTKYEGAVARTNESYSRGTRELHALALRLALTDALYEGDLPFIILDDPFMSFDDKTLERAKSAVKEISRTRQVIYFTCSRTRAI